jgi:hypothetical protein
VGADREPVLRAGLARHDTRRSSTASWSGAGPARPAGRRGASDGEPSRRLPQGRTAAGAGRREHVHDLDRRLGRRRPRARRTGLPPRGRPDDTRQNPVTDHAGSTTVTPRSWRPEWIRGYTRSHCSNAQLQRRWPVFFPDTMISGRVLRPSTTIPPSNLGEPGADSRDPDAGAVGRARRGPRSSGVRQRGVAGA